MGEDHFRAVKEQASLSELIEALTGQQFKRVGSSLDLPECPFCQHRDCFRLPQDEQIFKCFSCGATGDVFNFVERLMKCSPAEALKEVAGRVGYDLKERQGPPEKKEDAFLRKIRESAADHYHENLVEKKQGLNYQLRVRRHSLETLRRFRIGHADGKLHEVLSRKGFSREQVLASGLVKEKDGRLQDFFLPGLYIYPHLSLTGHVGHFTIKDPEKKFNYQLPKEFRDPDCLFFNMPAFKGKEVLLVEGENDLLSVYGRGDYQQVAACCGQLSREQVGYLVKWAPGKGLYMCFDQDPAGRKYQETLQEALRGFCLSRALAKLTGDKSAGLRTVSFNHGGKDIDELLHKEEKPKKVLAALLQRSYPCLMRLKSILARHRAWCEEQERKVSPVEQGELIFGYFQEKGKYFCDGETCFLYDGQKIHEIGANVPFKSMIYTVAGINYAGNQAKAIWEVLQARAYEQGDHATVPGWIHTDREHNTIYFNLCNERNELIKISPGNLEIIQNGVNPERILLRSSPKMQPLTFIQDAEVSRAMACLKELLFDNLTCELSNRFFILARLLNTLLIQFTKARGIDKFSGPKGSGKTAAVSLETALVYGRDYVTVGSAASNFSEATVSPLTIEDNLETDNVRGDKRDFLLVAATGATKQKRKAGTDSENVYERICTQVIVTAIEPFLDAELIERTNDISFNKKFFSSNYLEATALESRILANRDLIWSAFFKILAHNVLPAFNERRTAAFRILREEHRSHAKSRLNELYSCLFILASEILKYIPHPEYANDSFKKGRQAEAVLQDWLLYQERRGAT